MLPKKIQSDWADRVIATGLGLFFFALYLALRQRALTIDGAAFIAWFQPDAFFYPHHPIFGYFLHGWIRALELAGIRPVHAGLIQSALAMSLCVVFLYYFLRGEGIVASIALAVAVLLGWNGTAFSAATIVETDAISFLVVMINLLVFTRVIGRPSLVWDALFFLSSLLVLAIHMGWCFWVLAIYLTLAWHERRRPWRAMGRLAEGGGTALIMVLVFLCVHLRQGSAAGDEAHFFATFWEGTSGLGAAARLFKNSFFNFAAFAGFVLFPAGLGLGWPDWHRPALRTLTLVVSGIYLVYFSFWIADEGRFFMPLFPLWGLLAAYGLQSLWSVPRSGVRWAMILLALALMLAYGGLLVLSQRGWQSGWLAFGFWGILLAQWVWGRGLARSGGHVVSVESSPVPAVTSGPTWTFSLVFLVLALAGGALAYGPRVIHDHQTTPDRMRLEAFRAHAPADGRLATWIIPPYFGYAITLHPTISTHADIFFTTEENLKNREKLERWLMETAEGTGPALYFDDYSYQLRNEIWSQSPSPGIPLAALRFVPVDWWRYRFYRVEAMDR